MRRFFLLMCLALAAPATAKAADVVFLGEVHDNPHHHQRQAEEVRTRAPAAIVWEMLSPEQATRISPELLSDARALEAALGWADSGWPDFAMYYPIFQASAGARHYGAAVPRDAARAAMQDGVAASFGAEAADFGLDAPLPDDQQSAREALQLAAHCDAMPAEMLPMMVDIQRLRDASLAQAARQAWQETKGPVAVITGNGHARKDWGAPALLAFAAPALTIEALGQGEDGFAAPSGLFDRLASAPSVERPDPCAAFRAKTGN